MIASQKRPWYTLKGTEAADRLVETFQTIDSRQTYRRDRNKRLMAMYSGVGSQGFSSGSYADTSDVDRRLQLNVIDAVIDTAQAMLATNRPRPYFLTIKGNEEKQRRAKGLNQFALGQFLHCDLYDEAQLVFVDAATLGTGFLKIYEEDDEVCAERVFTDDIVVDDVEARKCKPRSLYQHDEVSKEVLKAQYPEHAAAIDSSGLIREGSDAAESIEEPVGVIEAWHLPSADGAGDGRHIIATDQCTLFEEAWDEEDFPFAVFRMGRQQLGFWGAGWISKLRGIQREINAILMKIQRHLRLGSTKVFIEGNARIAKSKMTNQEFEIFPYTGGTRPPVIAAVEPISPTYAQMLEYLYGKAFELTGVNQLSAQSQKPPGLSGIAIQHYNDLQSARHQHLGQSWERLFIHAANRMIHIARQIDERGDGSYKVMAQDDKGLEAIKWSDVSLDDDKFVIQAWPASLLPNTPHGKYQAVSELSQAFPQLQPHAFELMTDIPDLDAVSGRINAPYQMVSLIICEILKGGKYIAPEPFYNLEYGVEQMQFAYVKAQIDGVNETRLEKMRTWIKQAIDLMPPPEPSPMPPPEALPPEAMPPEMAAGPAVPPEAILQGQANQI
jgi:hypothetical protein